MKINFLYHTPVLLEAGYMGSEGLKKALERKGLLHYAFNQQGEEMLDVDKLQAAPIFIVRGFLDGRMQYVGRCADQFKACWQSESFYTRHGNMDSSTPICVKNQKSFDMMFTCADTDLDMYEIPTYYLPSWADISILDEVGDPEFDGLGFYGGREGREDFLNGDKKGIINYQRTAFNRDADKTCGELAKLISKFSFLVSPPGRCFNGMCGRAFEIMACKRLCFQYLNEDTMPIISKYFKDGEHLVYFRDWDELNEKYEHYMNNPGKAKEIALNGYHEVRDFHNQDLRAKYIVECMNKEHKKWLANKEQFSDSLKKVYAEI